MIGARSLFRSAEKNAERRDASRRRVVWMAQLETGKGSFDCRVSNISPGGARVRVPDSVGVKEPVTLITDHGEFFGTVAWERDGVIGIKFSDHDLSGGHNRIAAQTKRIVATMHGEAGDSAEERAGRATKSEEGASHDDADPLANPLLADLVGMLRSRAPQEEVDNARSAPAPAEVAPFVNDERVRAAVAVVHPAINELIDPVVAARLSRSELRRHLNELLAEIARDKSVALSRVEQQAVLERILDEMLGLGPLEPLLADDTVNDILINGPKQVYVERRGRLEKVDVAFVDDAHLVNIALRAVTRVGRRLDESVPLVDARLPDGSRINVILPPLALHGPMISIRKFAKKQITLEIMARQLNLSPAMATVLRIAARCRLNIIISGGTGSGKTTLLNAISQHIDPSERVITIEDAAELQLQLPHVGSLETRPANVEGTGEITMRDLFKNSLRMRPDRIILGEIRGAEAFDVLQAMNTGHDGSLATIHASGPREALSRLESIIAMCGLEISSQAMRSQISSAVNLIVQVSRLRDGKRRITHITELVGMEGPLFTTQDLFNYQYQSDASSDMLKGRYVSSGLRPHFMAKAEQLGLQRPLLEAMNMPEVSE